LSNDLKILPSTLEIWLLKPDFPIPLSIPLILPYFENIALHGILTDPKALGYGFDFTPLLV
jgi:hypothetical protein